MISFPNAKINLGLRVLGKRPDGYHNLETIMYHVGLCDAMEVICVPSADFSIDTSGLTIPGGSRDNLCTRAYLLMKKKYNLPEVKMHLHKCIPMGAGLGGGSADAAFTLKMLNKLFELDLNDATLRELAAAIGSDCPFFIKNIPSLAQGRGEILEELPLSLQSCHILVIKAPIHIDTSEAYAFADRSHPGQPLKNIVKMPVNEWKNYLISDFERYAFQKHPVLKSIKQRLYEQGAAFASLTGSGSAIYGIFDGKPPEMDMGSDHFVWSGEL
jgi:4-diphosphocytidyl-2-C-methyl-D-erythritol kinase